ncbi:MAG: serine/threonine protein kinase, partial [Myxococcales bacterium]|nr:serine/threonine protein kinase [Myxococcales bacterium]
MSQAPLDGPRIADADASAMATRRAPPVDLYLDAEVTRPQGDDALKAHLLTGGGARIGRFRILRQLGEGGMGLIFAARDAELNREVALKILRPRERDGALSRARMVREAQALARLSHANVVTVYEVGEHEGHVFIAMELVHGRTLAGWLNVKRPGWRAIVAVFAAAGRGLAAAHRAGIIHRDFKPTNVIVGRDGRVTVIDFGIAIAPGRADTGPLTLAGTISGTPSYMAPEQVAGAPVDPRADQYAFATSLYEALVGERPYKGSSLEDRLRELLTEPQPTFPKGTRLPKWLQRAVLRGLAQDPDHRFPAMDEFIAALERDPRRPRRFALFAGAAIALAAAGYAVAYQQVAPDSRCDAVDAELADAWDGARAAAVEAALQATDVGFADDTFARLAPLLDGYRDRWIDARRGACVANLAGELPTDLYGLEVACLDQQRRSFAALTSTLTDADADA